MKTIYIETINKMNHKTECQLSVYDDDTFAEVFTVTGQISTIEINTYHENDTVKTQSIIEIVEKHDSEN